MPETAKRGLGRGLSALMADLPPPDEAPRRADREVAIARIRPNPGQPRRAFDEAELSDLAASIRARGVIQPIMVRPDPEEPGRFQIVAGERRWRAAQIAGLHEMPVVVRDADDREMLELAIVENIQRSDLGPMEEAAGYRALIDGYGHTQEQLGEALGRSRSHVANVLRLLTLPEPVQRHLREGALSAGHARALVGASNAEELAARVVRDGLSVREAERLARAEAKKPNAGGDRTRASKDADTLALEGDLSAALGMGVRVDARPGGAGRVIITYSDLDALDRLCELLARGRPDAPS